MRARVCVCVCTHTNICIYFLQNIGLTISTSYLCKVEKFKYKKNLSEYICQNKIFSTK